MATDRLGSTPGRGAVRTAGDQIRLPELERIGIPSMKQLVTHDPACRCVVAQLSANSGGSTLKQRSC
jgi:hypothetical protein